MPSYLDILKLIAQINENRLTKAEMSNLIDSLNKTDYDKLKETLTRQTDYDKLKETLTRQTDYNKLKEKLTRETDYNKLGNTFKRPTDKQKISDIINQKELYKEYLELQKNAKAYQNQYSDWGYNYDLPNVPKKITSASIERIKKYSDREFLERKIKRTGIANREYRATVVIQQYLTEIQSLSPVVYDILFDTIQTSVIEFGELKTGETLIKEFENGINKAFNTLRPQYPTGTEGSKNCAIAISSRFLKALSKKLSDEQIENLIDNENVNNFEDDTYYES